MSEPTLEWPGAKTTKQAAKYLLTSGFVAVEYCRALTTERDSLRAKVAELEAHLDEIYACLRANKIVEAMEEVIDALPAAELGETPKEVEK